MSVEGVDRFVVVGDIHGEYERLSKLLHTLQKFDRRVIFVGDYVNRGPDSKGVIQALTELKQLKPDTTFLLGNHDNLFMKFLQGGNFTCLAKAGGLATIRSYIPGEVRWNVRDHLLEAIPPSHMQFFLELALYWENSNYLVSHVGFDPNSPEDRGIDSMALKDHPQLFTRVHSKKTAVFGHYIQPDGKPFVSAHVICLDTGSGLPGGTLSAMMFPERHVLSS